MVSLQEIIKVILVVILVVSSVVNFSMILVVIFFDYIGEFSILLMEILEVIID